MHEISHMENLLRTTVRCLSSDNLDLGGEVLEQSLGFPRMNNFNCFVLLWLPSKPSQIPTPKSGFGSSPLASWLLSNGLGIVILFTFLYPSLSCAPQEGRNLLEPRARQKTEYLFL